MVAPEVDEIVKSMPPPGKMGGGDDEAAEGEAPGEYNAEEDSAMEVARALGADPAKVDIPALCEALKGFIAIAKME